MGKEFEYVFDVASATTGEVRQELVNDDARNKVVYLHRRADDLQPFYIGIGNADRPYVTTNRNDYWTNTYAKHGRIVEILHENLTWDEACEIEIRLIKEYREKYPDTMTNLTDGGEGSLGLTGEDNGYFKGYVLFLSLCGKYYFMCCGRKGIEDAGFNNQDVYAIINGTNNYEYVSSRKIHINGKRIRFKPFRVNDESEIDDAMIVNCVEAEVSTDEIVVGKAGENHHLFGCTGELHKSFKGYALGVSQTHFVLLAGYKDMKSKKFHQGNISSCISGRLKHYKKFIWSRIDKNFDRSKLQTLRDHQPFDQDSKDRLEELLK